MAAATAFAERIRQIYRDDLVGEAGVVHVTSVWAAPSGDWVSLRIGARAPESDTDAFALAVARARADAIVTTGAILRAEPRLSHALPPDAAAWRAARLGGTRAAVTATPVVLTRRPDVDLAHPVFTSAPHSVVVTNAGSAEAIRTRIARRGESGPRIETVALDETDLRSVLAYLKSQRGCRSIVVEAGVRASRPLYDPPIAVDELMLSLYCGAGLAPGVRGATFLAQGDPLRALLEAGPGTAGEYASREASGPWRFQRHRLAASVMRSR